jgi:hypothetical protein
MDTIEVGRHEEKFLIDYMSAGSSVAKLMFDFQMLRLFVKSNAHFHAITKIQEDANYHAQQVATRVYSHAFKELRKWRSQ